MARLEIRLLGGFDVRRDGVEVRGFESRNGRALLAYLALLGPAGETTRDRVSALLWPDEAESAGRQNLRQALYNLRRTLGDGELPAERRLIDAGRGVVRLNPEADCWLDVVDLRRAVAGGLNNGDCRDPRLLDEAVRLYRGPLLEGLYVDSSPEFETWLLLEQERLRDTVLEVLRSLVMFHAGRREHVEAVRHARHWVSLDPLSEEAHRTLMELYAAGGQRSRALAQYERLKHLMSLEMGLAPVSETTALYERILTEEFQLERGEGPLEASGPAVPLVGRRASYSRLRACWEGALAGRSRLTLVTGPEGIGKTRLIKSFIHDANAESSGTVVLARSRMGELPSPYEVIADLVRSLMECQAHAGQAIDRMASEGRFPALIQIAPASFHEAPLDRDGRSTTRGEVARELAELLSEAESELGESAQCGLTVFVDDLQWADAASLDVLCRTVRHLEGRSVWITAGARPDLVAGQGPVAEAIADGRVDLIELGPLDRKALGQLAEALVGPGEGDRLAEFLARRSGGTPLAVTEWVNLLRDLEILVPGPTGVWAIQGSLDDAGLSEDVDLRELVRHRVARLPASARRVLVLAAVLGHVFEIGTLGEAADEHPAVLDVALGLFLDRWIARHSPRCWFASRRERDVVLWRRGVRSGRFEFTHKLIRGALYESVSAARLRRMHRDVSRVLERHRAERDTCDEHLAEHLILAGDEAAALEHLERAVAEALRLDAADVARVLAERAITIARRQEEAAGHDDQRNRWRARRTQLERGPSFW